jgi:hypothetical protein
VHLARFFRESLGLARPGQVGHDHSSVAELLRQLVQRFFIAGGEHKLGALAMQTPSDVRAQSGRGAGEEHSLAAQVSHRLNYFSPGFRHSGTNGRIASCGDSQKGPVGRIPVGGRWS